MPVAKSSLLRSCGPHASEPHPNPADASPDNLYCASNSREGVLQIEAARQPALPAYAELRAAPRHITDAARQSIAIGNNDLRRAVQGAPGVASPLHARLNAPRGPKEVLDRYPSG